MGHPAMSGEPPPDRGRPRRRARHDRGGRAGSRLAIPPTPRRRRARDRRGGPRLLRQRSALRRGHRRRRAHDLRRAGTPRRTTRSPGGRLDGPGGAARRAARRHRRRATTLAPMVPTVGTGEGVATSLAPPPAAAGTVASPSPEPLAPPPAVVARPVPAAGPVEPGAGRPGAVVGRRGRPPAGYLGDRRRLRRRARPRRPRRLLPRPHGAGHRPRLPARLRARRRPYLWLFQDTFLDHGGNAERLDQASFAHNTAMVQDGSCFTLLHRGTATAPTLVRAGHGRADPAHVVLAARRRDWSAARCTCSGPRWPRRPIPGPGDGLGWDPGPDVAGHVRRRLRWPGLVPTGAERRGAARSTATPWPATTTTRTCSATRSTRTWPDQGGFYGGPRSATACRSPACPGAASTPRPEYRTGDRLERRPARRRAVLGPLLAGEPDAAPLPRRPLGGRRRRSTGTGARSSPSTSPTSRGGRGQTVVAAAVGAARRRPADEHVPRPPDAVAVRRRAGRQRLAERPRHARPTPGRTPSATACSSSAQRSSQPPPAPSPETTDTTTTPRPPRPTTTTTDRRRRSSPPHHIEPIRRRRAIRPAPSTTRRHRRDTTHHDSSTTHDLHDDARVAEP